MKRNLTLAWGYHHVLAQPKLFLQLLRRAKCRSKFPGGVQAAPSCHSGPRLSTTCPFPKSSDRDVRIGTFDTTTPTEGPHSKTAYHVGSNPSQTQGTFPKWILCCPLTNPTDDINVVMDTLAVLADLLRQSGIGALPLLETDATGQTQIPTEAELMKKATEGVQVYFEKVKRAQESSAVVANLLGSDQRPPRP